MSLLEPLWFKIRQEAIGEADNATDYCIADFEPVVTVPHHAEALFRIDENDEIGRECAQILRRGTRHQRRGVNDSSA
jgi:hypothetical protein